MKSAKEILDSLQSPIPGKWREEALWRKENRVWLLKSGKIALRILEHLNNKGMTQKDLAHKMGVSTQYISKIVKGSENLSLETIGKIENALGIELVAVCVENPTVVHKVSSTTIHSFGKMIRSNLIYDQTVGPTSPDCFVKLSELNKFAS